MKERIKRTLRHNNFGTGHENLRGALGGHGRRWVEMGNGTGGLNGTITCSQVLTELRRWSLTDCAAHQFFQGRNKWHQFREGRGPPPVVTRARGCFLLISTHGLADYQASSGQSPQSHPLRAQLSFLLLQLLRSPLHRAAPRRSGLLGAAAACSRHGDGGAPAAL